MSAVCYLEDESGKWELTTVFRWVEREVSTGPVRTVKIEKILQQKMYREIPYSHGKSETKWRDIPIGDEK